MRNFSENVVKNSKECYTIDSILGKISVKRTMEGDFMSLRVLVVDDAAFMRQQLKEAFAKFGAEVVGEASDGSECLQKYAVLKPDMVTMDITMENMDGITALKLLKEKYPEARIVMVSAMGQQEKFIDSIQAGAFDFIVKPFKTDRIGVIVNKLEAELKKNKK